MESGWGEISREMGKTVNLQGESSKQRLAEVCRNLSVQ